ncbi:hypothetical protein BOX15_Mlig034026g2, partial [Macrostomum lignano]
KMNGNNSAISLDEHVSNGNGIAAKSSKPMRQNSTYSDWEVEKNKNKQFHEDFTINNFFWRTHTITCLVVLCGTLIYVTGFEEPSANTEFNTKRGILAVLLVFLFYGVIYTPDGPFVRPHPAFWRFVLCLSVAYELGLIFILFQNVHDARKLLRYFDPELGRPLPEKDYGGNCLIYDPANATDPFHNVWDKLDGFVTVHFFGWWLKTLILRDYWLCCVLSFMFEILEYTLEHQLPNFSECWWDHWIMDFLLCNGLGIVMGMKTCNYLSLKPYYWTSMWNIPGYKGKLKRFVLQFTPYRWTDFDWTPTKSFRRWVIMLMVIAMFLLAEVNTFYLKYVLWVPPPHFLCLGRLVFFLFMGATAMREVFQYLDDPKANKFGRQSWVISAIIITETLISVKFDPATVTKPLPRHVIIIWSVGFSLLSAWTVWNFFLKRFFYSLAVAKETASPKTKVN